MVLSIGEILVDIFKEGESKSIFAGGAPFNVAANIAHFNGDVAFYGAVGRDEYGDFLKEFAFKRIKRLFIETKEDKSTTQAIVTLTNGERSFKFVRDDGSDFIVKLSTFFIRKH